MAEKAELDDRDRKNLYRATADNIHVVEISYMDLGRLDLTGVEEFDDALVNAHAQVRSQNEDRSFIVIKVVR